MRKREDGRMFFHLEGSYAHSAPLHFSASLIFGNSSEHRRGREEGGLGHLSVRGRWYAGGGRDGPARPGRDHLVGMHGERG